MKELQQKEDVTRNTLLWHYKKYTMLSLYIGWQETKLQPVYWYKNSNSGSSLWDYL